MLEECFKLCIPSNVEVIGEECLGCRLQYLELYYYLEVPFRSLVTSKLEENLARIYIALSLEVSLCVLLGVVMILSLWSM